MKRTVPQLFLIFLMSLTVSGCATNPAYQTSEFFSTDPAVRVGLSSEINVCSPGRADNLGKILHSLAIAPLDGSIQITSYNYTAAFLTPGESIKLRLPFEERHAVWFSFPYDLITQSVKLDINGNQIEYVILTGSSIDRRENRLTEKMEYSRKWSFKKVSSIIFREVCGDIPQKLVTHRAQIIK